MPGITLSLFVSLVVLTSQVARPRDAVTVATVVLRGDHVERISPLVAEVTSFIPSLRIQGVNVDLNRALIECGTETTCIASTLRQHDVDLGIVVAAVEAEGMLTIAIDALDTNTRTSVGRHFDTIDLQHSPFRRSVIDIFRTALAKVGHETGGRLVVRAEPKTTTLSLAEHRGVGRLDVTMPPGPVELRAEAPGFDTLERSIVVVPGETASVDIELEASASILSSPWLWVGVGIVVAGTTAAVVVSRRSTVNRLCQVPTSGAACTAYP